MAQSETGFVDVEGGQLYYDVAGTGHPLLLIHAGVADHTMWDSQFSDFAEHYRVIRYDMRGFGKSRTESVSFSNRQDIHDLLRHLEVERAYVIGISRGGQIAIDYTLEHPEMVAALIPVASGLSGYEHVTTDADRDQMVAFEEMEAAEEQKDYPRLIEMEVRMWVEGPGQPDGRAPAAVRERVRAMITAGYARQDGEPQARVLVPPAVGRLEDIAAPTLVIVGDLDTSDTLVAADVMVQHIPHARKVVIPGVAHMVPMEKPSEFTQTVLEFLRSIEA